VLGPDTVNNNNMFHGIISQVNMYDSMLNATYIATESGNGSHSNKGDNCIILFESK
jgi:hypothetical protein